MLMVPDMSQVQIDILSTGQPHFETSLHQRRNFHPYTPNASPYGFVLHNFENKLRGRIARGTPAQLPWP